METKYKDLFTPWKIGKVEIKNRIVMTSMGGTSIFGWMKPCGFSEEAAHFLLERAKNNVGLILPGIAPVRDPIGGKWLYQNKGMFRKLKKFMVEYHKTGAKLFIQLTAGFGRAMAVNEMMEKINNNKVLNVLAKPLLNVDFLCASCSPTPNRWSDKIKTKELTQKQIHKFVEAFAKISKLCKEAGVDGVEVHAVHEGYLLDQFTLKYCNQRTDEYGGSFENRYRFPVEIVKAIKAECGKDFPVSLRYSVVSKTKGFREGALPGEEFTEVGRDMKESEKAARYLEDAGYDMLNCDNGTYDAWYWAHPPMYMPTNCNLEDVAHIKKFVDIPVVCAGRMDAQTANKAIQNKEIDAMGVARQFLCDPEWVTKLLNNDQIDIRPCICCHNACFDMAHYNGVANDQPMDDTMHMSRCALNPETMQMKKYYIEKTKAPKNIAVIGGGIGGMEVARVAALRGHKVTIYEKSAILGGIFVPASNMNFKETDRRLIQWYKKQINDLNVTIKFNTEIKNLSQIKADEIVVATGALARKLKVKGAENAIEVCDYLKDKTLVKEEPIIIGGGLTGCEAAYQMCLDGKKPTIVEMKSDLIAQAGVCLANSSYLREYFALHKIPVYLETSVKEIGKNKVICTTKDGKEITIKGDSVVTSVGYISHPLFKEDKHVHIVGDAYKVGNLRNVIWRAWDVAMKF
jgi:NADH:flavin oxidoreductases, Old Yellow Enzyme family